jgi:hypothetical protein
MGARCSRRVQFSELERVSGRELEGTLSDLEHDSERM